MKRPAAPVFALLANSLLAATLLSPFAGTPALAQGTSPEGEAPRSEARRRFDRGLALFDEGDNSGALAEFKRTYALVPNRLVLYNIGMVYAAMNRPVESADTLEKVLADAGPLSSANVEVAQRTRVEQAARVAYLSLTTNVPATIEVDGVQTDRTPLQKPLRVAAGTHIVGALASGYLPARREVVLAGGATETITVALEPSEAALAHLVVRSPVPGAEVVIDGQRVGVTPLSSSLTVKPGTRVVELRRPGYLSVKKDISLGDGASGELALPLEQDAAGGAAFGVLSLEISETDASVTINGQDKGVYRSPFRLPAGPHVLAVERGGFESTSRVVEVNPSGTTAVRVSLAPTPQTRSARAERTRSLRQWGWVSLISGGVVGVAGGTFAALAHGKHGDAQDALATTQATFVPGGVCDPKGAGNHAACNAELASRSKEVDDQSLRRTLGAVAVGVGIAAAVTGAVLLVQNPHAEGASSASLSMMPLVGVTAQGATIEFQGRF